MSTIYYLACHDCKVCISVGKNGNLWTQPSGHVQYLAAWLVEHERHALSYASEHDPRLDHYPIQDYQDGAPPVDREP